MYCSAPVKASFPMDSCLHPCTWSLLHPDFSFLPVFPSVWHFLCKPLAAVSARGIMCSGSSSPTLVLTNGLLHAVLKALMEPALALPVVKICALRGCLYSVIGFSKSPGGLVIFESLVSVKLCLQVAIASKVKGNKQVDRVWLHRPFLLKELLKNKQESLLESRFWQEFLMSITEGNFVGFFSFLVNVMYFGNAKKDCVIFWK